MSITIYNHEKMYTYIKGFATGAGMKETLKAISYAREKHSGQLRKSGQPYISSSDHGLRCGQHGHQR